jgi:hypothetical protein
MRSAVVEAKRTEGFSLSVLIASPDLKHRLGRGARMVQGSSWPLPAILGHSRELALSDALADQILVSGTHQAHGSTDCKSVLIVAPDYEQHPGRCNRANRLTEYRVEV